MLDVGFSEILLTSAIALIVLGPERLPKVARQVGNWMGRARAMARQLTEQLEREVSAEELMKQTQSNRSKPAASDISGAPSPFDNSATPTIMPPPLPPDPVATPVASQGTYTPDAAAAPHGADWHPAPPGNKTSHE